MKRKVSLTLWMMAVGSVLITIVLLIGISYGMLATQTKKDLRIYGDFAAKNFTFSSENREVLELSEKDIRITLLSQDGQVLFDNYADASMMENHALRPEVKEAFESGWGEDTRKSDTIGKQTFYYAKKLSNGGVLRVASEMESTGAVLMGTLPFIILVLFLVSLLSFSLSELLTRRIVEPIERMAEDIEEVAYDELAPFARTIRLQRVEIENQLKDIQSQQKKMKALVENMVEGFLLLDSNKTILMMNESAARFLNALAGADGQNIVQLTRNPNITQGVDEALKGKSTSVHILSNGRDLHLLMNPVYLDGRQEGIICLILDVTEKMGIERMKREFTANVSHELKTPLTAILGYAQMIENGMAKEEDIAKFAGKISKESARLQTLIGDIITLSRLEEFKEPQKSEPVDLLALARQSKERLELAAREKDVEITVEGQDGVVSGNEEMLSRMIYNLCDNAIRYNKQGGKIMISAYVIGEETVLSVKDTGIGIPKSHQSRIFERFYRVDQSRSKETGGTGLGLSIVKHIAEQHKARIVLTSEENTGTEIKIIFPYAKNTK